MRPTPFVASAALVLLLAACGGGSSGSDTTAPAVDAPPPGDAGSVPPEASADTPAFTTFAAGMKNDDRAEAIPLGALAPPKDDTAEPSPLGEPG